MNASAGRIERRGIIKKPKTVVFFFSFFTCIYRVPGVYGFTRICCYFFFAVLSVFIVINVPARGIYYLSSAALLSVVVVVVRTNTHSVRPYTLININ